MLFKSKIIPFILKKEQILNTIFTLIFIVWARFFGLFVVLPVLSVYVSGNKIEIGLAVGAYALSQIIFSAPFGRLSDKIGRKNALIIGLVIFALGSLMCAFSTSVEMLILGRFVAGCGAIGAVASAFIADLVPDNEKSKYMAFLGVGVGFSFVAAMIVGPVLAKFFGLSSLFILCIILCVLNLILLLFVKEPKREIRGLNNSSLTLMKNKNLIILSLSNFLQKGFLNIFFVSLGLILVENLSFERGNLWQIYSISTIFGFFAMGVAGAFGDKKGKAKELFFSSVLIFILSISTILFAISQKSIFLFFVAAILFFVAFSLQEPILQSQTAKLNKANRGAMLGILNGFGYAGSFVGSLFGAFSDLIFYIMLVFCCVWIIILRRLDRI